MALIVEDGTGLATAESYDSIANMDAYHALLKNTAWTGAVPVKEAAARKATRYLDARYSFSGSKLTLAQTLQWPRYTAYQDDWLLNSATIPLKLKQACAEAAALALTQDLATNIDPVGGQKRIKVDVIELEYFERGNAETIYSLIDDLLKPLLAGGGSRGTFRIERV